MAEPNRVRPFKRNLTINPYALSCPILATPKPLRIGNELLRSKGITSYTMQNPNLFWVWYRGWIGPAEPALPAMMLGHLIAPGGEHLRESQTPDWIIAVPWARPGWPLLKADGSPVQADADCMLIYTLGSGGL